MKRKLISYICLVAIFMETIPVNALSNITSEIVPIESSEETKSEEESTEQKDEKTEEKEDKQKEESKSKLEDNVFNMYILDKIENELGFSIGFDEKEKKFKLSNQSEKQLSKTNLDSIIYKINIYDKENKEKLNIELLGKDTGNSEKLNILKDTKYETGDTIKIASFDPKKGIKILGEIKGDINKEKQTDKENEKVEDYSDGVDNLDYIDNVRFKITETNLETVYNNAPVFEGLTDLLDVEDPSVDVLQGIKVTDDHDGLIDNSKIVVSVQEQTEFSAILQLTVEDSWGRTTSTTRNISGKEKINTINSSGNDSATTHTVTNSATTPTVTNSIESNTITVDGVPYSDNRTQRFKIRFDATSKEIKVTDDDGRVLSYNEKGEYFKFVLYDKNMEEKTSVTLLGNDKSDSDKLNAINNYIFEDGDYIGIWHEESDTKLKIDGTVKKTRINENKEAEVIQNEVANYSQGVPKLQISERRFRIKTTGLEEVKNAAPTIDTLEPIVVNRGEDKDLLEGVAEKVSDDFDRFDAANIEKGYVSITHTPFDNTYVGTQIITYTATDRWGNKGTANRTITVNSENPLDSTYIELMKSESTNESLFKLKIDSVKKQLIVDNLNSLPDTQIDPSRSSSIFKLKIYTRGGVLQKTLNIKGTDKLKTVLRRINGYTYSEDDRIELWSINPKNIRVFGDLVESNSTNATNIHYESNEVDGENYREDYTNGIDDQDYMKNVRFEIGKTNLKYIYNEAPVFTISGDLIVRRKGDVNYMEGISASDDHDDDSSLNITHTEIDTSTIGEKYIEYKVVDSWGRNTLKKRKITVYPYNNLEYNYINIKNNQTKEVILSIRFDEDNRKFKVNKLDASKIPSGLSNNSELLKIELIKQNKNSILKSSNKETITITITRQDLINNTLNEKFENIQYNYGDYLVFNSYDYANGILISAKSDDTPDDSNNEQTKSSDISDGSNDLDETPSNPNELLNGFRDVDQMENSRFKIEQAGLQMIYNAPPKIDGLENILYLYSGEKLDIRKAIEGITVKDDLDDLDKKISTDNLIVKSEDGNALSSIDTTQIGDIILTYEITDSWGRTTYGERIVSIISKSASNDIEFYSEDGSKRLFHLKYRPIEHGFDFISDEHNPPNEVIDHSQNQLDQKSDTTNPSIDQEDSESGDLESNPDTEQPPSSDVPESPTEPEKVFKLSVFNTNGEEVGTFELSEDEISNPENLDRLKEIDIYDDYYFSVWSNNRSRIKITGYMEGNNTLGESGDENEDYSTGISSDDHMNSVRFKLRTRGLEAVYNKKPEIIISSKDILTQYAGDPIDYTQGVEVIDDHDQTIPIENIKVSFGEKTEKGVAKEKTENDLIIGDNTIYLSVVDSWGRESTITRKLVITNGIDKNRISFKGTDGEVIGIGFDHANNRLVISNENKAFGEGNVSGYVRIAIKRDENTYAVRPVEFNVSEDFSNKSVSNKLQPLRDYQLNYGDKLEIYHGHPIRFLINGKVIDAREDYEDGVDNPENLINTTFEITKSGLKAIYTNPDTSNITDNKVVFGPMAPEKFPVKIQIDFREKKFKVLEKTTTKFSSGDDDNVYRMVLIGSNGTIKRNSLFRGDTYADTIDNREFWHDQGFDYNDCLYIWHKDPKRSIIKGNIINKREDYEDGVDNPDNMNHVVFRLTQNGLESIYNEAPVINGAESVDVYKGSEFNLVEGITITDKFDTDRLSSISINGQSVTTSNDGTVLNPNRILLDTSTVGEKTVTYTATDRWGKETTINRKIIVRPYLYKNTFKIFSDVNEEEMISESDSTENKKNLLFEIGFDTVTNKYRVFNRKSDRISTDNSSEEKFYINILGSDKSLKAFISLTGNDRGTSPKLDKLNEVDYGIGDIIRIYRSDFDAIEFVGNIENSEPNKPFEDNTERLDIMKNTGFIVREDGLTVKYNNSPTITDTNGELQDRIVSKNTVLNLLEGINFKDEEDGNISDKNFINIRINGELLLFDSSNEQVEYEFNELGTYNIDYTVYDSWGRGTLKTVNITVEAKVRDNEINVYKTNNDLAFKIKFDTTNSKFILTDESNFVNDISSKANKTTDEVINESDESGDFKMIVRDIRGNVKYSVILNGDQEHDVNELKKIHNKDFSKYDTISLYSNNANGIKITGSVINKDNNGNKDYSNGFVNIQNYSLVRFKITDDGLKETINKTLRVLGIDSKTIKRGSDIDLLEGVTVDTQDDYNEDYKIKVDDSNFNKLKENDYTVKYTITNSWGQSVEYNRTITVEPRNELEKNKLSLKNNNGEVILKIGFDSIENKLRVLESRLNANIDSNNTSLAFAINAYNSEGNTIGNIELKGTENIDQIIIDKLNNFEYVEGYRLSIWAKHPQTHLTLEGNIKALNKETKKIIGSRTSILKDDIDKMENGRFEILNNGLAYIYNEAPIISGGDDIINYYKGSILTLPSGIKVDDDYDTISRNQIIIDDDNVNYDELGIYNITYIVEDNWGRVGKKPGRINIKSSMENNSIDVYPKRTRRTSQNENGDNKAFSIKFVRDEESNKNKLSIEKGSSVQFNSSSIESTFMTIKIYSSSGEVVKEVTLLGRDTNAQLDGLNDFEYERGGYIGIEGITEDTKSCVKIQGTVVNKKSDYTNGIQNIDHIENVRFKLTDLGLESVYNEEPKIVIDESIELNLVKGDEIPYMRGVKLLDDHDKLTKDNVEVTWNPGYTGNTDDTYENIKGYAKVGRNILQYKVTDSWGRSKIVNRTVNLTNGILNNTIHFDGNSRPDAIKMNFTATENNKVHMTLNTTDDTMWGMHRENYYTIKIYNPNGTQPRFNIGLDGMDRGNSNKLDGIRNIELEYGTIFEFTAGHPSKFKIKGSVRNAREEYFDGVQNPENLTSIKFKVTDSGLKSIYTDADNGNLNANENIISLVADENIPIKFKVDPITRKINVISYNSTSLQYGLGEQIETFRMTLTGSDGQTKANVTGYSRDKGDNSKFRDAFNDRSFEIGDTLTIWHKIPKKLLIKGEIQGKREDYSDGVDNSRNLEDAVFRLTATGLEAVYKEAPKITGVKDARVLKNEDLNLEQLIDELRARDNVDGDYDEKVIISENTQSKTYPTGTIIIDPTSVNTNKVGVYEVTYSVVNSNNRTARRSSTVVVYDRPTITETSLSRIELNSIDSNDEDAIISRLKQAVIARDGDDELFGKETKLEVVEHNVNPNLENIYEVTYKATDLNGEETEEVINITVSRTINVSVPTTIPFQVVTNLKKKEDDDGEDLDPFISGVMNVKNNNTSDVSVSIESFTRVESNTTKNRNYDRLEIVAPNSVSNWNTLSEDESMKKISLGIFNKEGLYVNSNLDVELTKDQPLWLLENMDEIKLGTLKRATNLSNPYVSKLSFTSKHGKNFKGGSSKGKFNLVFKFE
ncbi:MAG: putative mucin/carbohydrate-binding domain-containing protein [Romboutsia timonensis]